MHGYTVDELKNMNLSGIHIHANNLLEEHSVISYLPLDNEVVHTEIGHLHKDCHSMPLSVITIKPIRIPNNGKRARSFFKYGLTHIATLLLNAEFQTDFDVFKFLSCT